MFSAPVRSVGKNVAVLVLTDVMKDPVKKLSIVDLWKDFENQPEAYYVGCVYLQR